MELDANVVRARPKGNTSFFKAVFHGLNAVIGVGILSIPYALSTGGWLSLIFLLIIATTTFYTCLLTKRCMDTNPNIVTYFDMGQHAYGKIGKSVMSTILYVDLYLALTGYLILEGDNLHNLFPNFKIDLVGIAMGGKECFMIMVAIGVLPTVWLEDLRLLAYVSATGVITALIIIIAVLWVGTFDSVGFHNHGHELINLKGVPMAVSLYMFAYGGSPVFPTLYNAMQNKQYFSMVLLICFVSATILYTSMAFLGYMMYGSTLNSQITLNLPTQNISSNIAIYTAWIAPLSKYALFMEPVAFMTESWFPNQYREKRWFRIFLKTVLVVSQVILAISIPFFDSLMSLVGALFSATAAITIPSLCYLKILKIKLKSLEGIVIMMIIFFSVILSVGGTYTSILSIVTKFTSRH